MKTITLAAAAILFAAAPGLAQAPYGGTATGSLTVDGKPIALKYAYVIDVDNVEEAGLRMAGARKSTTIVLCDRPLPRSSVATREAPFSERVSPGQILAPLSKGVADQMYGIVLKLEPAKANPLSTQFLFPGNDSLPFNVVGTEYPDRVTDMKRAGGFLSGTALVPSAQLTRLEKGPKKYQYRVMFRAPILTETPVKENLDGPGALASPQVAVLKAYMEAGKKGDAATLRKLTATTHQSYIANKDFLESLKSAEMEKLPEQVKRVVVRGDTATILVVAEQPSYSQVNMHLVREKGDWKLCWP